MKTNLKIGLTGSTGFLGSRLSRLLKNNNYTFYSYGRKKNPLASKNITLDLYKELSKEFCESLQDIDVFIHMAGKIQKSKEDINCSNFFKINTIGTEKLIKECHKRNVKEFIYVSSANVLKPINGIVHENSSYGECKQSPYYLSSKISAEIIVKSFQNKNKNINIKIIRPSSIYGYGMKGGVIQSFINKLFVQEKITISGNGNWGSDLIYIDDVAYALFLLIFKSFTGPINIATGKVTTIKEIAYILCEFLNSSISLITFDKAIEELDSLPKNDIQMAKKLINFEPTEFKKGLNLMVNDFIKKL